MHTPHTHTRPEPRLQFCCLLLLCLPDTKRIFFSFFLILWPDLQNRKWGQVVQLGKIWGPWAKVLQIRKSILTHSHKTLFFRFCSKNTKNKLVLVSLYRQTQEAGYDSPRRKMVISKRVTFFHFHDMGRENPVYSSRNRIWSCLLFRLTPWAPTSSQSLRAVWLWASHRTSLSSCSLCCQMRTLFNLRTIHWAPIMR